MKDDDQPRSKWKPARVEEAYASEDGLVRKVKLAMSTPKLDKQGRRKQPIQTWTDLSIGWSCYNLLTGESPSRSLQIDDVSQTVMEMWTVYTLFLVFTN